MSQTTSGHDSQKERLISLARKLDVRLESLTQEFAKIDGPESRSSVDGEVVVEARRLEDEYWNAWLSSSLRLKSLVSCFATVILSHSTECPAVKERLYRSLTL